MSRVEKGEGVKRMPLFRWYYDKSVVAHGGWRRSLHLWIRGKHRLTVRW